MSATRRQVGPDTGVLSVWSLPYLEIVSPVSAFPSSGSVVCLHGRRSGRFSAVAARGRAGGPVSCLFPGLAGRMCSSFHVKGLAFCAPCRPGHVTCLLMAGERRSTRAAAGGAAHVVHFLRLL